MVKLRNLQRRMRVFNLEHPHFLSIEGENGVGKPESLTLLPLETREVPGAALECFEVRAALRPRDGSDPTLEVVA